MTNIIICLIVCLTIIISLILCSKHPIQIHMIYTNEFPGESDDEDPATNPDLINAVNSDAETQNEPELSEKEQKEALMRDVASVATMLLNGEVDFDEVQR